MMDDIKNESLPAGHLGCSAIQNPLVFEEKKTGARKASSL